MEIRTSRLLLRTWRRGDESALVRGLDHRAVWRNVGDSIPHPYTPRDAEAFLARVERDAQEWDLAIVDGGEAVGGIGLMRRSGIKRFTAEVGYWIGPSHWGRGIATEAVRALASETFAQTDVQRLEAHVFAWNPASGRVLEKAGFAREATLRSASFKDGALVDEWLYARLRGA